jgi:VWFA-related protein
MNVKKALAILLIVSPAVLLGQAQQEPLSPFQESVEVHVMSLDVVVTDSQGRLVRGLAKEDFTVRLDGRAVAIDYFAFVDEGTIHAPDLAALSPEKTFEELEKEEGAYVPRHFLIYLDVGNLPRETRNRTAEALRDFVTRLGPGDSTRLILYDRVGKELTGWTGSKETLLAAVGRFEKEGVGMARLFPEVDTMNEIDLNRDPRFGAAREFTAGSYAEQERGSVLQMLRHVSFELSTLAPMPGKKSFLLISGGFSMQPGHAMMAFATGSESQSAGVTRSVPQELTQIVQRANTSEVTFYTVDARGLSAEGISMGQSIGQGESLSRRAAGLGSLARNESQSGLFTLAGETGGLALVNSDDLNRGLSRVYQDSSTYYSIGVNLAKVEGTGYRSVSVDVARPGVNVRTRRGYAPLSPQERAAGGARATLVTNMEYRAFPVELQMGPTSRQKKLYAVPIEVTFPATALTFLPWGDGVRADAELYVGIADAKGRVSGIRREEIAIRRQKGAAAAAPVVHNATFLQTKKGEYRLVVNVRDKATGKMGTGKINVRVK